MYLFNIELWYLQQKSISKYILIFINSKKVLKEYTKLHVKAALLEAGEKYIYSETNESDNPAYLKDIILSSYPEKNIVWVEVALVQSYIL